MNKIFYIKICFASLLALPPLLASGQVVVTLDIAPPTCAGYTNGSITAMPQGGEAPYTFDWSNEQHGQTTFGLGSGAYSVTVTDLTGNTAVASAVVADPPVLQVGTSPLGDICEGSEASYLAMATGGVAPYSFVWSSGETTAQVDQPAPGFYTVTAADANGCTDLGTLKVVAPLTVAVHTIDAVCAMLCDGSAEAIVAGGTGPYSFQWNTGATTQVIFPLPPGTYTVTVTDANGCVQVASGEVHEPPPIELTLTAVGTCQGSADAAVSATGGVPPYVFEWSHGVTGPAANDLTEGIYFVTVTDANGCKKDKMLPVSSGAVFVVANVNAASCVGLANGTASAVGIGGLGPYSFLWNNGETTPTATQLAPGSYTVTMTDGASCTSSASVQVAAATTIVLASSSTAAGCGTSSFGTATVSVASGGTAPFSYEWSDPQQQTTATATGLPTGSYSVTVTDAVGCQALRSVTVPQSVPLTILVQAAPASCHNTADGSAQVAQVSNNALPPLSYQWSNGTTEALLENALPGNYGVTVTDAQGCTGAVPVVVTSLATVSASFDWMSLGGCPGDSVQVQFTETSDFTPSSNPLVSWDWIFGDGQTANGPTPLLTFTDSLVTVLMVAENATGCRDSALQVLDFQEVVSIQLQDEVFGCSGASVDLAASVNDPNGIATFDWSTEASSLQLTGNGQPGISVSTADTGHFVVYLTVTTALGCVLQDSVEVVFASDFANFNPQLVSYTQCDGLALSFTNQNPVASAFEWFFNFPNDTISSSTSSDPSYTYPDTGQYTVAFIPLLECITDTFYLDVAVAPPPVVDFSYLVSPCSDTVLVSFLDQSATPAPITAWQWEFGNGSVSSDQNPVLALDSSQTLVATLTVDFETGCSLTGSDTLAVSVFQLPALADTVVACLPNPSAELNPNGNPDLTHQWSPPTGLSDPGFWNPTATVGQTITYTVTISDGLGCSAVRQVTVFVPDSLAFLLPPDVAACEAGLDTLEAQVGAGAVGFEWSLTPDFADLVGQQPQLEVPVTVFFQTYYFRATDAYGCAQTGEVTVGAYPVLAQVPDNQRFCKGSLPSVVVTGLAADDVLAWSPFDPGSQALNENATFLATVTNVHGCQLTDTLQIAPIDVSQLIEVRPARDTILQGESIGLSSTANFDQLCSWSSGNTLDDPGSCDPSASPLVTTTYTVEVLDPATGCRGSGQSTICVVSSICNEPLIFVPDAFTPNGDGLNDVLYVRGYNISEVEIFAIYDRWGEKVFESHTVEEGWDGTFEGREITGDVFAYYLKVKCHTGESFFKKGNVSVIR